MHYTAIIKDGGLFIPNVFSDLNDGHAHIVQVSANIEAVRQQLSNNAAPKSEAPTPKSIKKPIARQPKKQLQKVQQETHSDPRQKSAVDELATLNDSELSEILKAYINDGLDNKEAATQISLENV